MNTRPPGSNGFFSCMCWSRPGPKVQDQSNMWTAGLSVINNPDTQILSHQVCNSQFYKYMGTHLNGTRLVSLLHFPSSLWCCAFRNCVTACHKTVRAAFKVPTSPQFHIFHLQHDILRKETHLQNVILASSHGVTCTLLCLLYCVMTMVPAPTEIVHHCQVKIIAKLELLPCTCINMNDICSDSKGASPHCATTIT